MGGRGPRRGGDRRGSLFYDRSEGFYDRSEGEHVNRCSSVPHRWSGRSQVERRIEAIAGHRAGWDNAAWRLHVTFIDPITKESHSPSPEEMQALAAAGGVAAATTSEPEPIVAANGAPGLRLTDDQMTYSIATKNADGKVSVEHAQGKTEAQAKVRAASAGATTAGKERNDDR